MASFELIGYVKSVANYGDKTRITIGEYIHGRRDKYGTIHGEKTDLWFVFFPKNAQKHLVNFKPNDLVIVKGTIYQSSNKDFTYSYCVNGESIKHFYTRNMLTEIKQEKTSLKAMEEYGDSPNVENGDYDNDF